MKMWFPAGLVAAWALAGCMPSESGGSADGGVPAGDATAASGDGGTRGTDAGPSSPDGGALPGAPLNVEACTDGRQDGDEVLVDCGGSICRTCAIEAAETEPNDSAGAARIFPMGEGITYRISGRFDHETDFIGFQVLQSVDVWYTLSGTIEGSEVAGFLMSISHDGAAGEPETLLGSGEFTTGYRSLTDNSGPGLYVFQIGSESAVVDYTLEIWAVSNRPRGAICFNDDFSEACVDELPCEPVPGTNYGRCPAPICGDDSVDAPETCDDGNQTAGDGCDANCRLEPPPPPPVDDGNDHDHPEPLVFANNEVRSHFSLQAGGDRWFSVPLDRQTDLIAELSADSGASCDSSVSMEFYREGRFGASGTDRDSSATDCPALGPAFWPELGDVPPGTHLIHVQVDEGAPSGLTLVVQQVAPLPDGAHCTDVYQRCETICQEADGNLPTCGASVCGNGLVEVGEICDDGNDNEFDTCTSTCATPVEESSVHPLNGVLGGGAEQGFSLVLGGPSVVQALIDGDFACGVATMSLTRTDVDPPQVIPTTPLPGDCISFGDVALGAGRYRILVRSTPQSPAFNYTFHLGRKLPPAAGGAPCSRVTDANRALHDRLDQPCDAALVCRPTDVATVGVCDRAPEAPLSGDRSTVETALEVPLDHRLVGDTAAGELVVFHMWLQEPTPLVFDNLCPVAGALELMALDGDVLATQGLDAALQAPVWSVRRAPGGACDPTGPADAMPPPHIYFALRTDAAESLDLGLLRMRSVNDRCETDGRYSLCGGVCAAVDADSTDGICQ